MATAWGAVVMTPEQAAALFDKLAEMLVDSSPDTAAALQAGAEALTSG
jgi:hypothetical protein